jgi:hypothetical protein
MCLIGLEVLGCDARMGLAADLVDPDLTVACAADESPAPTTPSTAMSMAVIHAKRSLRNVAPPGRALLTNDRKATWREGALQRL